MVAHARLNSSMKKMHIDLKNLLVDFEIIYGLSWVTRGALNLPIPVSRFLNVSLNYLAIPLDNRSKSVTVWEMILPKSLKRFSACKCKYLTKVCRIILIKLWDNPYGEFLIQLTKEVGLVVKG